MIQRLYFTFNSAKQVFKQLVGKTTVTPCSPSFPVMSSFSDRELCALQITISLLSSFQGWMQPNQTQSKLSSSNIRRWTNTKQIEFSSQFFSKKLASDQPQNFRQILGGESHEQEVWWPDGNWKFGQQGCYYGVK